MPGSNFLKKISLKLKVKNQVDDARGRYLIHKQQYKNILISNAPFVFTCDANNQIKIFKNHSIIIENGIIKEVELAKKIKNKNQFDLVYDAGKRGGTVITPGFINAHAHIHMYLMRSAMMLDEGAEIDKAIFDMAAWQRHEGEEAQCVASIGDLTEEQKNGITSTLTHGPSFETGEYGARLTCHNLINAVSAISNSRPTNTPEAIETLLAQKLNTHSQIALSLHYLYKANAQTLRKVQKIIDKHKLLFTCHLAENDVVRDKCLRRFGIREVDLLEKYDLLNHRTLLSHVVSVNKNDIRKLARAHAGIVHLPTSNTIHKSGIFPFWEFYAQEGFDRMALGTDSVVSKSRLDILIEAYQTRLTHLFSKTVKFSDLFRMMTVNGARVLNLSNVGRLVSGQKADLAFWKLKDRGFIPYDAGNPITLLGNIITHSGRTVRDLMIGGKFVIKNRRHQLINESKLLEVLQKYHMQVRRKMERG